MTIRDDGLRTRKASLNVNIAPVLDVARLIATGGGHLLSADDLAEYSGLSKSGLFRHMAGVEHELGLVIRYHREGAASLGLGRWVIEDWGLLNKRRVLAQTTPTHP